MFAFTNILSQAAQLFHSSNISELMNGAEYEELTSMFEETGLDPAELSGLSMDETMNRLIDAGVDLSAVDGQSIFEALQSMRPGG